MQISHTAIISKGLAKCFYLLLCNAIVQLRLKICRRKEQRRNIFPEIRRFMAFSIKWDYKRCFRKNTVGNSISLARHHNSTTTSVPTNVSRQLLNGAKSERRTEMCSVGDTRATHSQFSLRIFTIIINNLANVTSDKIQFD